MGEPGFFYLQGWEMLAVFWVFTVLLVSLPRQLVIWQRDLNGANQLFRFPACPRPPWRGPTALRSPFRASRSLGAIQLPPKLVHQDGR
ncbi:MAG: hypothetical protein AAF851_10800 [Myxococcota bacterium]